MDNPLQQTAPTDPLERVHTFARDLAYGAAQGKWGTKFQVNFMRGEEWYSLTYLQGVDSDANFIPYIEQKWENANPTSDLLESYGYLTVVERFESGNKSYLLTPKAFALLEKPTIPPAVFISYARRTSSALALLIEARLKLEDRSLRAFIDKDIPLGDEWRDVLEARISASQYFICLLTMDTLLSKPIAEEIEIALRTPTCKIIPICHNGYRFSTPFLADLGERAISAGMIDALATKNALVVDTESAASYEDKVNRLLSRLGYSTI
ncbi:MAG: toll/interleukin-1 receptor domain-containing protein [Anaerolineae bacterium]|nr:toll/interleukin-1 receptor domain-containing protein [Anaerolineae bacterium]